MSYSSIATALASTLAAVPGITTVQRDEQVQLGKAGSVIPLPAVCPLVRISRSRRMVGRERAWTHSGTRDRSTPYQLDVWAYKQDAATDADGFLDLVDSLQAAVRRNYQLGGAADTTTTALIQVRPLDDYGVPRALTGTDGRPVLHATFSVLAREAVR